MTEVDLPIVIDETDNTRLVWIVEHGFPIPEL